MTGSNADMRGSRRYVCLLVYLLVALTACAPTGKEGPTGDRVILPGTAVQAMLNQCSRSSPVLGEGTWQPTEADVKDMEALLPSALVAAPDAQGINFSDVLAKWQRQYVGVVRDGRRFIYGNFFPRDQQNELAAWRKQPMIVCDGGPAFFGAEYDVDAGRITHVAFNGSI